MFARRTAYLKLLEHPPVTLEKILSGIRDMVSKNEILTPTPAHILPASQVEDVFVALQSPKVLRRL